MTYKQQFDVWKEDLRPVLQSKVEEFQQLGLERVEIMDIWECVLYKLRKQTEFIHLHEFVRIILSLRDNEYMNWLTIAKYNTNDWFSNEDALDSLLNNETKSIESNDKT